MPSLFEDFKQNLSSLNCDNAMKCVIFPRTFKLEMFLFLYRQLIFLKNLKSTVDTKMQNLSSHYIKVIFTYNVTKKITIFMHFLITGTIDIYFFSHRLFYAKNKINIFF